MDTAISARGIGKQYRIGAKERSGRTLREAISALATAPFRRLGRPPAADELFWALKDVSFDVARGSVMGIIGRNGAGKSTLLKILSRVTEPTEGRAELRGRVSSLLEVGTGFHPELTGRENVYLSGAILGMKKEEIRHKFDEIVGFAEVELFLDTPVKRYSSGMYARLAFAVAAHLESEILIVDEVLAVGDASFQKKCLGKMGEIGQEGRTVLLVSHNMASIVDLCDAVIWIDHGGVQAIDDPEKAVQSYLTSGLATSGGLVVFDAGANESELSIRAVHLRDSEGKVATHFDVLSPIFIDLTLQCRRRFATWRAAVRVTRYDGVVVFTTTTIDYRQKPQAPLAPGWYQARLQIPGCFLSPAQYLVTVTVSEPPIMQHDIHENVLWFEVVGQVFESGRGSNVVVCPFEWQVTPHLEADRPRARHGAAAGASPARVGACPDPAGSRGSGVPLPRILANSIPKAGTNLLLELLGQIEGLKYSKAWVDFLMSPEQIMRTLGELQPGDYIYGHLLYDAGVTAFLERASISHVLMVRDPRDVAVSLALYVPRQLANRYYEAFARLRSDRERIICAIQGIPENAERGWPALSSMDERYSRCAPWLEDERCLVVRFEDLIGSRGGGDDDRQRQTVRDLVRHLGLELTESQLHNIPGRLFSPSAPTFRKGEIGGWRQWLDDGMLAMLSRDRTVYRRFGYEL